MQYPDRLIPRTNFKQIQTDLSNSFLCRGVGSRSLLEKVNGFYPDDILCEDSKEFFDYSTNLLGHFLPEDNQIALIGENKKYFYTYWDFAEEVTLPVYQQDFEINERRHFFLLPVTDIHLKICLPMPNPPKRADETLTASIVHTPTRSNFWHFSICWIDKNGVSEKYKGSEWQKRISATMRHVLQEFIITNFPDKVVPISSIHYVKSSP